MMKIAIFDTGIGGFTILKELRFRINAEFIYFGDSKNLPYGDKSDKEIEELSIRAMEFLVNLQPDIIIIACHTVSAIMLKNSGKKFQYPIIGIIEPTINQAVAATQNNKIGLIGTDATIKSGIYKEKFPDQVSLYQKSCPILVPLIESNASRQEIERYLIKCLCPILSHDIDTLVLGCTHYAIIDDVITKLIDPNIELISSKHIADQIIRQFDLENVKDPKIDKIQYYTSGNVQLFKEKIKKYLG